MSEAAQPLSFDPRFLAASPTLEVQPGRVARKPARPIHQPIRVLQAFAILMVVYAHSVIPGQHFSSALGIPDRFIRICGVPVFIFVSGFLYCYTNQGARTFGRLLKEKSLRMLLPYVCLSTVAFLIKAELGRTASRPVALNWASYFHQLIYPWDNAIIFFWFLPTLFVIYLMSIPLDKWVVRPNPRSLFVVLALLIVVSGLVGTRDDLYPVRVLNICGALNYLVYFWAGYAVCHYQETVVTELRRPWLGMFVLGAAFILTVLRPDATHGLAALQALAGSIGLFAFTNLMAAKRNWKAIASIGDKSYQIYLLAWFFQTMPIVLFSRFVSTNEYVCAIVSFTLGTGGPLCASYFVDRWAPRFRPIIGLR